MKLYTSPISPNGKRVRIAAAELGLELDTIAIDFAKGENRAPEYLAMNPLGKVPTLSHGDFSLWESAAILVYLASQAKPNDLYAADARGQADTLRWLFFCSCHIDPHFTTLIVERFIKARRHAQADEALVAAAERELARFVPVLEEQLAGREFLTGRFGLADIALGCTMELSGLLHVDLSSFPNVNAWLLRLQERPAWRGASASP
jgi:glutathione S-transferase